MGGMQPATATQTAGPGQPGSSGGFSTLLMGGLHNPPGVPENPALLPTPSTTSPSKGTNVTQNGSGLTGGQTLPPINTANATTIPIQGKHLGFGKRTIR